MGTPVAIARILDHPVTLLVTRICVTLPFLVGGVTKLANWDAGLAEMTAVGLHPAGLFNLAVLATELGGSALVILDRKTWLGAGALGIFSVLTTVLAHRFWAVSGPDRTPQFNSFLEHATISAAFVLVTVVTIRSQDRRQAP
ncbi:MAG: DoxX family protein [Azospirillaceae bacterium]|nr:DoxX family protein [Azospirillaceae bacterium]